MDAFPEFMKHPANRIARSNQATPGVEGYVFDGANGNQMAFWTCGENATSSEHLHDYDESMVVVQGCYTLVISHSRKTDCGKGRRGILLSSTAQPRKELQNGRGFCFQDGFHD